MPKPTAFELRKAEIVDALGEADFAELLDTFFDDAQRILNDLRAALNDNATEEIDRLLHTLKGAAGNVGFTDIASVSQRLREERLDKTKLRFLSDALSTHQQELAA